MSGISLFLRWKVNWMMTVGAELRLVSLKAFLRGGGRTLMPLHYTHTCTYTLFLMSRHYSLSICNTCLARVPFILLIHSLVHVNRRGAKWSVYKNALSSLQEKMHCSLWLPWDTPASSHKDEMHNALWVRVCANIYCRCDKDGWEH